MDFLSDLKGENVKKKYIGKIEKKNNDNYWCDSTGV